jgi:hypothetical protein
MHIIDVIKKEELLFPQGLNQPDGFMVDPSYIPSPVIIAAETLIVTVLRPQKT